jgi:hypothetical protein
VEFRSRPIGNFPPDIPLVGFDGLEFDGRQWGQLKGEAGGGWWFNGLGFDLGLLLEEFGQDFGENQDGCRLVGNDFVLQLGVAGQDVLHASS